MNYSISGREKIYSQRCNFSTWRFRWKLRLKHFPQDGHWIRQLESNMQCCGSGSASVCFCASRIRIRIRKLQVRIWIRLQILQSSNKNSKKNLDFYCFVTSLWIFPSVPDLHPDTDPYVFGPPGSASGSVPVPKCHGSTTLQICKYSLSNPSLSSPVVSSIIFAGTNKQRFTRSTGQIDRHSTSLPHNLVCAYLMVDGNEK